MKGKFLGKYKGASVEIAISKALNDLNKTQSQIVYSVVQEQKRWFSLVNKNFELEIYENIEIGNPKSVVKRKPKRSYSEESGKYQNSNSLQDRESKKHQNHFLNYVMDEQTQKIRYSDAMHVVKEEIPSLVVQVREYIYSILKEFISEEIEIECLLLDRDYILNLTGNTLAFLIGKGGENLRALQIISSVFLSKTSNYSNSTHVIIDVDAYWLKKNIFLKQWVNKIIKQLASFRNYYQSEKNFSSFDRKIIYEFVKKEFPEVNSYSLGTGLYKKIVFELKT